MYTCLASDSSSSDSKDKTMTVADIQGELVLHVPFYAELENPDSTEHQQQEAEFCNAVYNYSTKLAINTFIQHTTM